MLTGVQRESHPSNSEIGKELKNYQGEKGRASRLPLIISFYIFFIERRKIKHTSIRETILLDEANVKHLLSNQREVIPAYYMCMKPSDDKFLSLGGLTVC